MKNFNNLKFIPHPMMPGATQARVIVGGRDFSVISGDMFYSVKSEDSYEIGEKIDGHWEVEGFASEERITEILNGSKLIQ